MASEYEQNKQNDEILGKKVRSYRALCDKCEKCYIEKTTTIVNTWCEIDFFVSSFRFNLLRLTLVIIKSWSWISSSIISSSFSSSSSSSSSKKAVIFICLYLSLLKWNIQVGMILSQSNLKKKHSGNFYRRKTLLRFYLLAGT